MTGPDPSGANLPAVATLNPERLEAPELVTNSQFVLVVFEVIPAEKGESPVETELEVNGVRAPVTGL